MGKGGRIMVSINDLEVWIFTLTEHIEPYMFWIILIITLFIIPMVIILWSFEIGDKRNGT